ncbi:MAG: ABC transporter permease [Candidatus Bathyarchaeia archaeon]|nr:ABC transporter permease [Candidatus Bathyarchaeia archaeon]
MVISKEARIIWRRRIRNFWFEYSHNKIGLVGLTLLIIYISIAIFGHAIAPFNEEQVRSTSAIKHADKFALPEWVTVFPGFSDWPRERNFPLNWTLTSTELPDSIMVEQQGDGFKFYYDANRTKSAELVSITLKATLDYQYAPRVLRTFALSFMWEAAPSNVTRTIKFCVGSICVFGQETGTIRYILKLDMTTPEDKTFPLWDQEWFQNRDINPKTPPAFWSSNTSNQVNLTPLAELAVKLGYESYETTKMVQDMFAAKGLYTFTFTIIVGPGEAEGQTVPLEEAKGTVKVSNANFNTWGRAFGILGTDGYHHDVFSQLILGSRISIAIGISAAAIAVTFGLFVGITAGYLGGIVDEALMRIVDILICLPALPILLVLIAMFGYNVWYVVLILAIFGWQGLSRVIRSQVLSLREMAFIESAIASGGSKRYIMMRHIIPNVLPIALTSLVLSVPSAIILESALSFLGFGDPFAPTWGKMLQNAYDTNAFSPMNLALWDILPPGFAITFLCLTFVFIGHAVDEIVNPKLRRRR